mmetsp:Transcript_28563/g.59493  ORF Transcript_28563/g.59493 Transcript_28563/m.59493 type:complete len:887 (+) Transcript_28563:263-2923(+)
MPRCAPGMDDDVSSTRKQESTGAISVQARIQALDLQHDSSNQLTKIIKGSTSTDFSRRPPPTQKYHLFKSAQAVQKSAVTSPKKGSNSIFDRTGTSQLNREKYVIPSKPSMFTPALGTATTGAESNSANNNYVTTSYNDNRWNENSSTSRLTTSSSNYHASSVNKKALDIVTKRHTQRITSASRKPPAYSEEIRSDDNCSPCDDGNGDSEEPVVGNDQECVDSNEGDISTEFAVSKELNSTIENDPMRNYSTNIENNHLELRDISLERRAEKNFMEDLLLGQQKKRNMESIESDGNTVGNKDECDQNYSSYCHNPRLPTDHLTYHQGEMESSAVRCSPISHRQLLGPASPSDNESLECQRDSNERESASGSDVMLEEIIQNDSSLYLSMEENEPYYVGTVAPTSSSLSVRESNQIDIMSRGSTISPDEECKGNETLRVPSPPLIVRTLSKGIPPDIRADQAKFGNSPYFPFIDNSAYNESTKLLPRATNDAMNAASTKRILRRVVHKSDTSVPAVSPSSMTGILSDGSGSKLEGASIISGSTNTASTYATSRMTSLSTRATRFLNDRRKGARSSTRAKSDVGKDSTLISEEFAKDLARSILTRKSTKERVNQKVRSSHLHAKDLMTSIEAVFQSVHDAIPAESDDKINSQSAMEVNPIFTSLNENLGNQLKDGDLNFVDINQLPGSNPRSASFQVVHDNSRSLQNYDDTKHGNRGEFSSSKTDAPSGYNSLSYQNDSFAEDTISYDSGSISQQRGQRHRRNSEGHLDYIDADSHVSFDSFIKGNSFDVGQLPSRLLDVIHSACETLSPTSHALLGDQNSYSIRSKKNDIVTFTYSEALDEAPSDEDVAIEVEYVDPSFLEDHDSRVSESVYSYSTSENNTASNSIN